MKPLKIILCIIALVAVFFCGVAYQSYSNHKEHPIESIDTLTTAKSQEELDSDNIRFFEEYDRQRLEDKEAYKEDCPECYANRYQEYDEVLIGMWEPILDPKTEPYRYEFQKNRKCQRYWHSTYEPREWVVVNKGQYKITANVLTFQLQKPKGGVIDKEWNIQEIVDGKMMVTYEEYDKFSKTYRTCELKLKRIK